MKAIRLQARRAPLVLYLCVLAGMLAGCAPATLTENPERGPAGDLARERAAKDDFFRSADSPLLPEARKNFPGLDYYPFNAALRFQLPLQRYAAPVTIRMATNTGEIRSGLRYGFFEFTVDGRTCRAQVYRLDESAGAPALFIPFLDATSGAETYEGGRYLDLTENTSGMYELDFNQAYNPYCAYNPAYSCPAPPRDNTLPAPIRAGEKKYRHQ